MYKIDIKNILFPKSKNIENDKFEKIITILQKYFHEDYVYRISKDNKIIKVKRGDGRRLMYSVHISKNFLYSYNYIVLDNYIIDRIEEKEYFGGINHNIVVRLKPEDTAIIFSDLKFNIFVYFYTDNNVVSIVNFSKTPIERYTIKYIDLIKNGGFKKMYEMGNIEKIIDYTLDEAKKQNVEILKN